MKKMIYMMVSIMTILVLLSCEKNEQDANYKGQSRLFLRGPLSGNALGTSGQYYYTDVNFSFARFPSTKMDTIITLTAQVVGGMTDYARKFAITIDPSSSALPDEYELQSDFIIPANSFQGKLNVKIKKTERLFSERAELRVRLIPTDDFLVNSNTTILESQNPNTTLQTSFLISWTSELTQPLLWYGPFGLDNFIGGYSKVKHQLIVDLTDYADFDIFNTSVDYNAQKYIIQSVLQQYVARYNFEHPTAPLMDENKIPVVISRQSAPRP